MKTYVLRRAECPILVSIPHAGVRVPDGVATRLTPVARLLPDTDWYVDRLYDFLEDTPIGVLRAEYSRYVVDINRPRDDAPLYPGQTSTGLCPVRTFGGERLYEPDSEPMPEEINERIEIYWRPYHERLTQELDRLRARFGFAVLWDAHSIRSRVPRLFEGELPELNLGTNGDLSCDPRLAARLFECLTSSPYSAVFNGRFRGGYITRRYGDPQHGVHAIQLELAQRCYMNEANSTYSISRADSLRDLLQSAFETIERCYDDLVGNRDRASAQ